MTAPKESAKKSQLRWFTKAGGVVLGFFLPPLVVLVSSYLLVGAASIIGRDDTLLRWYTYAGLEQRATFSAAVLAAPAAILLPLRKYSTYLATGYAACLLLYFAEWAWFLVDLASAS